MDEKEKKKLFEELTPIVNDFEIKKNGKEEKKKKKETWWSKHFNKDKLKKSNKVAIVFLRNNGNAELLEQEAKSGFFTVNGKTYHERKDCTYTITKDRIPLILIKEWDIIPIGTKEWDDKEMRDKFSELENHVLKGIRYAELVKMGGGDENRLSTKQMIIYGIIAIVGIAILMNYL